MISAGPIRLCAKARRRFAVLLAFILLFAGLAESTHFHRADASHHGDTHVQCLLCFASAGGAGPPASPAVRRAAGVELRVALPVAVASARSALIVSYDARGPPAV